MIKYIVNTLTVILLILLTIVVYGKCSVSFGNKLYPDYFGYTLFEVVSGSMEPTLYINDVVLVKIQKEKIEKDDIITFMYNNDFITHRVLLVDGDTITVKGDNNSTNYVKSYIYNLNGKDYSGDKTYTIFKIINKASVKLKLKDGTEESKTLYEM